MRIPLIGLGIAGLLVGLVIALTATASISSSKEELKTEQQLASNEALDNSTENFLRYEQGMEPLESEHDPDAVQEEIRGLETRRNIGWAVAGGGLLLAVIGLVTPATQRVSIVPADTTPSAGRESPAAPAGTTGSRDSIEDRLARLEQLRQSEVITQSEYVERRQRILDDL